RLVISSRVSGMARAYHTPPPPSTPSHDATKPPGHGPGGLGFQSMLSPRASVSPWCVCSLAPHEERCDKVEEILRVHLVVTVEVRRRKLREERAEEIEEILRVHPVVAVEIGATHRRLALIRDPVVVHVKTCPGEDVDGVVVPVPVAVQPGCRDPRHRRV